MGWGSGIRWWGGVRGSGGWGIRWCGENRFIKFMHLLAVLRTMITPYYGHTISAQNKNLGWGEKIKGCGVG